LTAPIVIVGCGGFGREVHDIIDAINAQQPTWRLLGYLDDAPSQANVELIEKRGAELLGGFAWLEEHAAHTTYVVGIGTGQVRKLMDERATSAGADAATLLHPSATVGHGVVIEPGSIICAGARLTTNIHVGRHVHVNLNATIGHDTTLHSYVTVNPIVAISGWVEVAQEATLGTHSAILQHLTVGRGAMVGAGACVVKSVPSDTVVKGVPAR
jgi:sugar O-acyltransferase (sialic acid O-acetyltransferase NeuD family)